MGADSACVVFLPGEVFGPHQGVLAFRPVRCLANSPGEGFGLRGVPIVPTTDQQRPVRYRWFVFCPVRKDNMFGQCGVVLSSGLRPVRCCSGNFSSGIFRIGCVRPVRTHPGCALLSASEVHIEIESRSCSRDEIFARTRLLGECEPVFAFGALGQKGETLAPRRFWFFEQ